jgi:hypothetical protein
MGSLMKVIRARLTAIATFMAAIQVYVLTIGVASCCLAATSHHPDMPEVCPMVHEEGETCPMHATAPASRHDESNHDESSHDAVTADEASDVCRIGCGPSPTHGLLQTMGGPRQEPMAVIAVLVSTALPTDRPSDTLDAIHPPFAPPPRG